MDIKLLIPLFNDEVAPRFDLATDVLLVKIRSTGEYDERIVVLPQASADDLCALATSDNAHTIICGGIDNEHYQYLIWKGIKVLDNVIGPVKIILKAHKAGTITAGSNFYSF
ncbi:dinitrogenase iron-molybdenum cofactor biosynthesis protein [Maridesulfovibrio ferrireducens]|uniref:dinitrogenase iron-molybdenum cofactor biosynthesis protein n=1 Tax=Maridesulfovibrio ferrireducens TaxID=246191 RepID=UPI001A1BC8B4|nr:dinitrogenase iron-molybdenum cofactor biosynthesis protein [Maridesulfovibrio ferrireducens]MBI9111821.1 dinitrogenase iron-molybdenum cofactor biosynthesis protein [Maridesulfovibrio ferrireducens]